jgi:hypothetical protein
MSAAIVEEEILELLDAIKPGRCPVCGRPILARRFESRALILQCSARCGWWSEASPDGEVAVPATRKPLLVTITGGRSLPRLF